MTFTEKLEERIKSDMEKMLEEWSWSVHLGLEELEAEIRNEIIAMYHEEVKKSGPEGVDIDDFKKRHKGKIAGKKFGF